MSAWKQCPKCKCLNKNRESCVDCGRDLKDVAADNLTPPPTAEAKPDCAPLGLLEDVERALTKINEAEGYFLLGKIASGKNMLGDGKAILEEAVERWTTSSNDKSSHARPTTHD